jgi:NO-binding membrane sensor protein with MHYT domain
MTALRLITLPAHGAVEFLLGMIAMVAPFALHFGPAGSAVSLLLGALLVGLALSTTDSGVRLSTHYAFDYAVAFGSLGGALLLGLSGDRVAMSALAGLAVAQLALNATTRYSTRT